MNQVTLPALDVAQSVAFYRKLGFRRMLTAMAKFDDERRAIDTGLVADE